MSRTKIHRRRRPARALAALLARPGNLPRDKLPGAFCSRDDVRHTAEYSRLAPDGDESSAKRITTIMHLQYLRMARDIAVMNSQEQTRPMSENFGRLQ